MSSWQSLVPSTTSGHTTAPLELRHSTAPSKVKVRAKVILRPTVSRPVCLGAKHLSGAYDRICSTVRQLRVCWRGALSLTRERVCHLQLLLILASAIILRSESRGTRDHILLTQIRDCPTVEGQEQSVPVIPPGTGFPFRRVLRLAGLRWSYSNPPPRGVDSVRSRWLVLLITSRHG
jgi:hypothetical protein